MYICIYIYIYIYTHTHTHMYIYMDMCICVCKCVWILMGFGKYMHSTRQHIQCMHSRGQPPFHEKLTTCSTCFSYLSRLSVCATCAYVCVSSSVRVFVETQAWHTLCLHFALGAWVSVYPHICLTGLITVELRHDLIQTTRAHSVSLLTQHQT